VWKGFDWDALHRLHEKGYITDPRGKAKSVVLTEEGLERSQQLLESLFGKPAQ
jgi:DNA-binding PadR family transcriptional regulator